LHQVGDLFELNVKFRCQKVKTGRFKEVFSLSVNKVLTFCLRLAVG
jgi:hypothetical protein